MSSSVQRLAVEDLTAGSLGRRQRPGGALIVVDLLALIGIAVISASLFLHGWVRAQVIFTSPGQIAGRIVQVVGIDVDHELTRIADREVAATLPPTLWQYGGHAFQWAFALFMAAAMLLIAALLFPRVRVAAQMGAFLACTGAASIAAAALVAMHHRSDSLPERVSRAIINSSIANRAFGLTTGKPELVVTIGWPFYAGAVGMILVLVCVLLGLVLAVARRNLYTRLN